MLRCLSDVKARVQQGRLRVVLASASPRRQQLLAEQVLGGAVAISVVESGFAEDHDKAQYVGRASAYATEYSLLKARAVERKLCASLPVPSQSSHREEAEAEAEVEVCIVGCDTVVVDSATGRIMEKPASGEDAAAMLRLHSGSEQLVVSGFTVIHGTLSPGAAQLAGRSETSGASETKVAFAGLDEETIAAYVATGEPMGKAGGFAVQGAGSTLITAIQGCYFNVVGLPVRPVALAMAASLAPERMSTSK